MTDKNNFKAVGIDHYYAIGCSKGGKSFDIAYTSDGAIATALLHALKSTWANHPNKRYRVHGFNGVEVVLEPYSKPHSDQYFWISVLSSYNPMTIDDACTAVALRINKYPWESDAVAVFASHQMADKVGASLMESTMITKTMSGFMVDPKFYFDYRCPIYLGESLNKWFMEGRL